MSGKLGQCAVKVTANKVTFLDSFHLQPKHKHLRRQCFELVVQRFGAKTYEYGSQWNCEDRFEIGTIPGFANEPVVEPQFHIDLIDCPDWPDFPTYCRSISENIRRDYRKAQQTSARVETRRGMAAFRDLIALARLRRHVMRKNRLPFSFFPDLLEHAAKLLVLGKKGFISTGRVDRKCLAAFFGTEFGESLFYHAGGTCDNRLGVGSYLFLTLIEYWFAAHPNGRILIGDSPGTGNPSSYTQGNLLYRRKLRVRPLDGLRFTIKYRPSDTAGS